VPKVIEMLKFAEIKVYGVEIIKATLEDAFLKLVGAWLDV